MSSDSESDYVPTPSKKKAYDLKFKLDAIKYAEKHNKSKAAKDLKVPRSNIKDWCKQKDDLLKQTSSNPSTAANKRLKGAGRHLNDEEFDAKMILWVRQQCEKKMRVTRTMIQNKAKALSTDEEFKASKGWLEKFMKRHNLSNCRPTTTCQKELDEYQQNLIDYILFVSKMRRQNNYKFIFACDETAVFIDASISLTVTEKGAKEVPILTTGHDKMQVTVMLTARCDGFKCKPFVLLKRVKPDKEIVKKFKSQNSKKE